MRVDLQKIQLLESYLTFLEMMYTINISRLTIRIKTSLNQMTKSSYLKKKKPMIEWLLLKKIIDHYIYLSSYSCQNGRDIKFRIPIKHLHFLQ